jgi:hypothetical protein
MHSKSCLIELSDLGTQWLLAVRKVSRIGEILVHEARDIGKVLEPRFRLRSQHYLMSALSNLHFRALEAKVLG